ncbi:unnamed protein product [Effrenium voratum]|nr:unnamed protein product [Effrenium voratum]
MALVGPSGWLLEPALPRASPAPPREIRRVHGNGRKPRSFGSVQAALCAACAALRSRQPKAARHAKDPSAEGKGEAPKAESAPSAQTTGPSAPSATESEAEAEAKKLSAAESRLALEQAATSGGSYQSLTADQRGMVNSFFFPDEEELDMDKSMPLEDHISELRDGVLRTFAFTVVAVGVCLYYYKELTTALEAPAQSGGMDVKFVQLAPGEFFFVSVKVAFSVGLLIAFPYALFEAALYFTPALTRSERGVVGPTVLSSAILFYSGAIFSFSVLSPAALGFFLGYSQDVIESQFSIDQYFEFILSMGFATGIAFQVPVLQVALGLLGVIDSDKLFAIWRYVVVGSAIVGAILTPSTDPVTQLLLSGALCVLYFAGGGVLKALGR